MRSILFTTAALALTITAAPASAQLLGGGGGGLGGGLGGSLGGSLGGTLRSPGTMTDHGLRRTTRGELRTERQVDRRSGRVRAGGDASGESSTLFDGRSPLGSTTAATRGSGSGSGAADAQLVGTDSARSAAAGVAGDVRGLAGRGREVIGSSADSAAAGAAGSAAGSAGAGGDMLALAGSAAATGTGSFDVRPGMTVVDTRGRVLGTVRDLRSDADGRIRAVLVQVGDRVATLPAANFAGEGSVLVSAMKRGEVRREAAD